MGGRRRAGKREGRGRGNGGEGGRRARGGWLGGQGNGALFRGRERSKRGSGARTCDHHTQWSQIGSRRDGFSFVRLMAFRRFEGNGRSGRGVRGAGGTVDGGRTGWRERGGDVRGERSDASVYLRTVCMKSIRGAHLVCRRKSRESRWGSGARGGPTDLERAGAGREEGSRHFVRRLVWSDVSVLDFVDGFGGW